MNPEALYHLYWEAVEKYPEALARAVELAEDWEELLQMLLWIVAEKRQGELAPSNAVGPTLIS